MVTGGFDKIINVFALGTGVSEPKYSLLGHKENVCSLDVSGSGLILSGSWDKWVSDSLETAIVGLLSPSRTARVWTNFSESVELSAHSAPVWAVLIYDEPQKFYLTG